MALWNMSTANQLQVSGCLSTGPSLTTDASARALPVTGSQAAHLKCPLSSVVERATRTDMRDGEVGCSNQPVGTGASSEVFYVLGRSFSSTSSPIV